MSVNGLTPVMYNYDDASRLTQVAQGAQVVNLGYDITGRRTSLTYPNGTATNYFYDDASRVIEISHNGPSGIIEDLLYTYDAAGNRISFNRTSPQADLPQPIQAAYNAANQTVQFNTDTLTYDANGNLTFDGTTTYTWDARNRLIQMSNGALFATFTYDALGRRVSKTINSSTTQYLYDGNDIVAEIQNGVITATYLRSLNIDEPFLRSSAIAEYYHTDALGSVLTLTDQNGSVQTTYSYDPFGNTTTSGLSTNPFQYTGRENESTGLYHYRARYYSPVLGRFLIEDPLYSPLRQARVCQSDYSPNIGRYAEMDRNLAPLMTLRLFGALSGIGLNPQQNHLYTYANDNPVNKVDRTGLYVGVPQIPGCDRPVPDFNKCQTKCCNEHDNCYKRALVYCDETSWKEQFLPFQHRTRVECEECNSTALKCYIKAFGQWGRKDC
jgi:RHS repeat-associated protein